MSLGINERYYLNPHITEGNHIYDHAEEFCGAKVAKDAKELAELLEEYSYKHVAALKERIENATSKQDQLDLVVEFYPELIREATYAEMEKCPDREIVTTVEEVFNKFHNISNLSDQDLEKIIETEILGKIEDEDDKIAIESMVFNGYYKGCTLHAFCMVMCDNSIDAKRVERLIPILYKRRNK